MRLKLGLTLYSVCAVAVMAVGILVSLPGCASPGGDGSAAPAIAFTPADAEIAGRAAAYAFLKAKPEHRAQRVARLERIARDIELALTNRTELTQALLEAWTARLVQEGELDAEDAAFLVPVIERVWARFRPDLAPLPTLDQGVRDGVLGFVGGIRAHLALVRQFSAAGTTARGGTVIVWGATPAEVRCGFLRRQAPRAERLKS